ncbi:hypothetical protein [Nocardioides nitrophenolicus]|uniref:hypothetical protein n=1 Tax=Nocardioides nitrophenolicus TaxID=60489 RepID=UPI0019585831|nr:hypothetical protein [Nocardioides nitrophenolicus]MBM7517093.1 hypothetical protein [Nocardioides nitrophenolicus]
MTWLHGRLRERGLRVGLSTLSYWRSGQRRPEGSASLDALAEIEDLLDLRSGSLVDRRGPSRRSGAIARSADVQETLDSTNAQLIDVALGELELTDAPSWAVEEAASFTVDLDEHGCLSRVRLRFRLRAVQDAVDRIPMWFLAERALPEAVELVELRGARPGRRVDRREVGLLVHELLLERSLVRGESAIVEASLRIPEHDSEPDTEFILNPPRRISEIELWVRFDRVPASCRVRTAELGGRPVEVAVDLRGARSAHHAVRGFGPGALGISWSW